MVWICGWMEKLVKMMSYSTPLPNCTDCPNTPTHHGLSTHVDLATADDLGHVGWIIWLPVEESI